MKNMLTSSDKLVLISCSIVSIFLLIPILMIDGIDRFAYPSPDLNAHIWYLKEVMSSVKEFNNVPIQDQFGYNIGHNLPLFYLIYAVIVKTFQQLNFDLNQSLQYSIFFTNFFLISIINFNILKSIKQIIDKKLLQYLILLSIFFSYEIAINVWRWIPGIWAFTLSTIVIRYTLEILDNGISKKRLAKLLIAYGFAFSFKISVVSVLVASFFTIFYKFFEWFKENLKDIWMFLFIPIFINFYTFFTTIGWERILNNQLKSKYRSEYNLNIDSFNEFLFSFQLSSFIGIEPIRPNYGTMVSVLDKLSQSLFTFSNNKLFLTIGSYLFVIFLVIHIKFIISSTNSKDRNFKQFLLSAELITIILFVYYSLYLPIGNPSRMRYNLWLILIFFLITGFQIQSEKKQSLNYFYFYSAIYSYLIITSHSVFIYMNNLFDYDFDKLLNKALNLFM